VTPETVFFDSFLVTLTVSATLTGFVRRWALAHRVLDVPNDRSSHTTPTPRGGGVAIVIAFLSVVACLGMLGVVPSRPTTSLLAFGGAIAAVGFADDKYRIAAPVRLGVHFAAVSLFVCSVGGMRPIDFGIAVWDLGALGTVLGVVVLVWFLNLYNFMDGIDGLAGMEAITTASIAAGLLLANGTESPALPLLLLLVAAVGGFLIWNWPPARIFMGDAGSGFLGFALGGMAWITVSSGQLSIWVWLILYGAFIVDATVTLLRRWGRGEPLATAHRSHAYQRLSRRLGSHLKVTIGCLIVNVVWLGPLAWVASVRPAIGALLLPVAWTPLAIHAWRCGAGLPDD
jgi:Fuc2NAc and GlcNAc transferase